MPAPIPRTLESLSEQHAQASAPATRAKCRVRARVLAAKLGCDVPDWAVLILAPAGEGKRKRKRNWASHASTVTAPIATPAEPLELPAALRSWRAAQPGRVINVKRDGSVRLLRFENDGARFEMGFADLHTAARALLLGVTWRPAKAKEDTRRRSSGGRVALPMPAHPNQ